MAELPALSLSFLSVIVFFIGVVPLVEEAARMEERGTHVLKLNIGNPAPFGFRTPDEVIYDMSQQLSDCEGYSPSQGLFSARKESCSIPRSKSCQMSRSVTFTPEMVSAN